MRKAFLILFLGFSVSALAKPPHLLYRSGKAVSYPIRHPQKTGHALWKLVTAVF
jgi:hypothetical protein